MSELKRVHQQIKSKYAAIVWFVVNGHVEAIDDCALTTAKVLGTILTNRGYSMTGFSAKDLDANLLKMVKAGHKVAVVNSESTYQQSIF